MNFNAIIAVLILKSVITEDEGQRLVEHLNDKPQSTVLKDAIAAVAEVIGKPVPVVHAPIGPVGPAQQAEELAARNTPVAQPVLDAAHVPTPEQPAELELAANEAKVDEDQASVLDEEAADKEVAKNSPAPSDSASEEKPASDETAKSTSDNKPKEAAKKK